MDLRQRQTIITWQKTDEVTQRVFELSFFQKKDFCSVLRVHIK